MDYRIEIAHRVYKRIKKLPVDLQKRIVKKIRSLSKNPFPSGFTKLTLSTMDLYRIRMGEYRIVYQVFEDEVLILVITVRHRKDVYDEIKKLFP